MREGRGIGKANRVADTFAMGPLKCALAVLPFSLLLILWPHHPRGASSLGLSLGVVCAQLVPPRQSIRSMLLWAAAAAILGAALPPSW